MTDPSVRTAMIVFRSMKSIYVAMLLAVSGSSVSAATVDEQVKDLYSQIWITYQKGDPVPAEAPMKKIVCLLEAAGKPKRPDLLKALRNEEKLLQALKKKDEEAQVKVRADALEAVLKEEEHKAQEVQEAERRTRAKILAANQKAEEAKKAAQEKQDKMPISIEDLDIHDGKIYWSCEGGYLKFGSGGEVEINSDYARLDGVTVGTIPGHYQLEQRHNPVIKIRYTWNSTEQIAEYLTGRKNGHIYMGGVLNQAAPFFLYRDKSARDEERKTVEEQAERESAKNELNF